MSLLTSAPPGLLVVAAAVVTAALGSLGRRDSAHAVAGAASFGAVVWAGLLPEGEFLRLTFLGFDAVLLNVDGFSRLMALIFGFIGGIGVVYSYSTDASPKQTAFALSYVGTSLGAVFAGDWLSFVFFVELMGVASTLLVWEYGGDAVRAGFRYALWHGIGGSLILAGVVWHYVEVGSFVFGAYDGIYPGVPALLYAVGFGVNVGYVGLHVWLPDTYPRPHIAASVFLCVYTTKTGVYGLARGFPDGHLWIAYMGGAMAVYGAFTALLQDDMRRLLSYHIESQVGYMVAGVGVGTALATSGAFAHVFNHILYKALLFMCAGAVIYVTGEEKLKNLGGLRSEMPLTAGIFGVAALSISGFPGFNGFVSKGMVMTAAHGEHLDVLWYLLLLGGVGTFMSFIKFGYYAFLRDRDRDWEIQKELRAGQKAAMGTVAALCVVYGIYPEALFGILPGGGASEAHPFTTSHVLEGLGLAAAGLVGFGIVKKPLSKVGRVSDIDSVYNRIAFYGTRASAIGLTSVYAAVDRAVVRTSGKAESIRRRPVRDVARLTPWVNYVSERDDGRTDAEIRRLLRAGIGQSTSVIIGVLTAVLIALMLGL